MEKTNRLLNECENTRAAEEQIRKLQFRVDTINGALQQKLSGEERAKLDSEWVETHLNILNLRYLISVKMDSLLQDTLLQPPDIRTAECPECARRANMYVKDILTDECPSCGRSLSRFVRALVKQRGS